MAIYIFDGSLKGLLTAIFELYERKHKDISIVQQHLYQPNAFLEEILIITDELKAKRVWKGLEQKLSPDWMQRFYSTYLSEQPESFQHLVGFARYIFDSQAGAASNYGNDHVLAITQMDRKVHREKHRMEAFVRFRKTVDGMFFAHIDPDYNVLPLIEKHFKNRYADQKWVIYDLRRKYGIFYDLKTVHEVTLEFAVDDAANQSPAPWDEQEELYSILWKDYFKSTNIQARKNMKLHIQHVPKRYWKYLTEKQN